MNDESLTNLNTMKRDTSRIIEWGEHKLPDNPKPIYKLEIWKDETTGKMNYKVESNCQNVEESAYVKQRLLQESNIKFDKSANN